MTAGLSKAMPALAGAVACMTLASAPGGAKPKEGVGSASVVEVAAHPLSAFDKNDPARKVFGKLEWRGGLVLTSQSRAFGGWSGLAIDADGRRLLAISDTGMWLKGELQYDGDRPAGIAKALLGPLTDAEGVPLSHNDDDAEGLAVVKGDLAKGEVLISFERHHRIVRYPVSGEGVGTPTETLVLPEGAAKLEWNRSLESVCQVKSGATKGAVVTLAERFPSDDGLHTGWLRAAAGREWRTLKLAKLDGFDITDCAGLPDGGMLVLERRYRLRDLFEGPKMRLRRFPATEFDAGGTMQGEVLIEAGPEQEIDNMEGLAVHPGPGGETIITMISDDNFNHVVQRTVLLQFALPAPIAAKAR